jgi:hypothetical protein
MSYKESYKPGDWKAICDVCGFAYKASELKDRWDGLKVCEADWETRHVADFIKAPKGEQALPWTRPEPTDQFVTVDYVATSVGIQDTEIPEGTNDGSL